MNDLTTRLHSKGHRENSGVRNICCSCRVSEFRFQYPVIEQNFCISKSSGFILFFWTWKTHVLMCTWVAEACTYIIQHKKASIKSRYNLYFFRDIYALSERSNNSWRGSECDIMNTMYMLCPFGLGISIIAKY